MITTETIISAAPGNNSCVNYSTFFSWLFNGYILSIESDCISNTLLYTVLPTSAALSLSDIESIPVVAGVVSLLIDPSSAKPNAARIPPKDREMIPKMQMKIAQI